MRAASVVGILVILGAVFYFAVWGLYELAGPHPCQAWTHDITGSQKYGGKTIECFHGDVVRVSR